MGDMDDIEKVCFGIGLLIDKGIITNFKQITKHISATKLAPSLGMTPSALRNRINGDVLFEEKDILLMVNVFKCDRDKIEKIARKKPS